MLRRKLLFNLGPLVALLLLTAVLAIWLLQGVLADLDAVRDPGWAVGDQQALLARFRNLVLGLALVFVIVINVSVIVLVRLGSMVLQPVDKLLEATRELSAEHFDYRVRLDRHDEFDELAKAYNSLAEQLQANERRRIETLGQVAVAMNHELNNAISIIDLQLAKLSRQSGDRVALEGCLRQIHDGLERVTQTVHSLKNVRRIVLTDYVPGTKMLDLQRSVEEDRPATEVHAP
jgi:methyl-accepting chemotaxis protein